MLVFCLLDFAMENFVSSFEDAWETYVPEESTWKASPAASEPVCSSLVSFHVSVIAAPLWFVVHLQGFEEATQFLLNYLRYLQSQAQQLRALSDHAKKSCKKASAAVRDSPPPPLPYVAPAPASSSSSVSPSASSSPAAPEETGLVVRCFPLMAVDLANIVATFCLSAFV